jgi:hypothetical protein
VQFLTSREHLPIDALLSNNRNTTQYQNLKSESESESESEEKGGPEVYRVCRQERAIERPVFAILC